MLTYVSGATQITHPSSALLGFGGEESLQLERSHYQLAFALGYKQQEYMQGRILDAVVCSSSRAVVPRISC